MRLPLLILLLLAQMPALAERIAFEILPGRMALAEHAAGDPGKPAVVLVHGFLQTHEFPTIRRLAEGLADEGYPVLAPTLTLGVPERMQSLDCGAIHTDGIEEKAAELVAWVNWLRARHSGPVVLFGHSSGASLVLATLRLHPDLPVAGVLLASLTYFGPGSARSETLEDVVRARADLAAGRKVGRYGLGYCNPFVATPEAYLSHRALDRERVMADIDASPVPVALVMGGRVDPAERKWIEWLQAQGAAPDRIDDANHFFADAAEFELLDWVLARLDAVRNGAQ